jgi:hypothetical protein
VSELLLLTAENIKSFLFNKGYDSLRIEQYVNQMEYEEGSACWPMFFDTFDEIEVDFELHQLTQEHK